MANIASRRIQREYLEFVRIEEISAYGIQLGLVGDDFTELEGTIEGPPDTPYEGGTYKLEIKIPDTYPFNPPKVRFLTKIWHPNVCSVTGAICLVLEDQWAAAMTLRTVLLSLQLLMADPEPDEPQATVVGWQYSDNHSMFQKTARHWAAAFAGAKHKFVEFESALKKLADMGVEEHAARVALSSCDWEVTKATERLFSLEYGSEIGTPRVKNMEEELDEAE